MMTIATLAPQADERIEAIAEVLRELRLPTGRLSEALLRQVVLAVATRPALYEDLVVDDPEHRWWMTLHVARGFDVRVLSWERHQESDWHDHGGSSGAFVVTRGALDERARAADGHSIAARRVAAGDVTSFGPSHVHDVLYRAGTPAVSVHAYSPPLSALTYYDHGPLGFVAREIVPEEQRRAFELAG